MKPEPTNPDYPSFERSFLPAARFEFVVMGDTHLILDPDPYAVEFESVRQWTRRAEWAIQLAAGLTPDFVIHLGDLTEENSAHPQQDEARRQALAQFAKYKLQPYHVAGNMDIGDKPDPTMWSAWVSPQSLAKFHALCGQSWYSFDHHDVHFVVLNSQLLNGPLPEAKVQQTWLESDLAANQGRRIFMFMHMPPFFVEEDEPDFGFYNSINQPARGWLTGLLRQYQVEYLFSGHTHFRAFHRVDATRFYVAPSTTTSRAGFYEAFSVAPPPEQGRNDVPKVGFYLIRVYDEGAAAHFIRTHGQTGPLAKAQGWRHLLCRTSRDLPQSPVGLYLRTPLAYQSAGALAWPSVLRQRVRDDHPFLSVVEGGVRHVRLPAHDLDDALQRQRLQVLRAEGVQVTATWIWSAQLDLLSAVGDRTAFFDMLELQVPGSLLPDQACLERLMACRTHFEKPTVLTPIIAMEPTAGKYHPRTRFGYHPTELPALNEHLSALGIIIDRVLCHIGPEQGPWDALQTIQEQPPFDSIRGLDYVIGLPGLDERLQAQRVAEALFAARLQADCRLFLDPLVDLDRTNDINHGLLDRLSNPRPAYYTLQSLNTALFSRPERFQALSKPGHDQTGLFGIVGDGQAHWLILSPAESDMSALFEAVDPEKRFLIIHLARGLSQTVNGIERLRSTLKEIDTPVFISVEK